MAVTEEGLRSFPSDAQAVSSSGGPWGWLLGVRAAHRKEERDQVLPSHGPCLVLQSWCTARAVRCWLQRFRPSPTRGFSHLVQKSWKVPTVTDSCVYR